MGPEIRDPHAGQPVLTQGPSPANARLTIILVHGRGGSAQDIMGLAQELQLRDVAYLAPQAARNSWYPLSFLAPIEQNEPWLSSALGVLARLVEMIANQEVPPERVALVGFSQGGCLSLEFAARHARRYAGVAGLSAGLIGPPGTPRDYPGTFDGMPAFLGCSDIDAHVPLERVRETGDLFRRMRAEVDERIYPQMGHTVVRDELEAVRQMLTIPNP